MQLGLTLASRRRQGFCAVVSLMLGLWLATSLVSVSPELHRLLHKDSQSTQHQCLITLLSKSHVLAGLSGTAIIPAVCRISEAKAVSEFWPAPSTDVRLAPSRAPPVRPFFPGVVG